MNQTTTDRTRLPGLKKPIFTGLLMITAFTMLAPACKSLSKTQKGAAIGTVGGGAAGAIIGKAAGNTALGAIIGATVGGVTGAVIGNKMDKQAKEIEKSVPGAKVERVGEGIVVEFSSQILFGFDKAGLSEDAKSNLAKLVTILNEYPDTDIEIQGHTDSKGSESYNKSLSLKRAKSVSDYLAAKGISSQRINTKGMGELFPKYSNEDEAGRSSNRRVEFLITANQKMIDDAKNESAKP